MHQSTLIRAIGQGHAKIFVETEMLLVRASHGIALYDFGDYGIASPHTVVQVTVMVVGAPPITLL